jgi:hypothetical protein
MVGLKEFARLRIFEDGEEICKLRSGDNLWRKQDKWMNLIRVIDMKNDRYRETITDPKNGQVIHHCDEKLSEHQGHGSAKKRA